MMHVLDIKRPEYRLPDLTTKDGMDSFLAHLVSNFIKKKSRMQSIINDAKVHIEQALAHVKFTTNAYSNFLVNQESKYALRVIWNDAGSGRHYETVLDLSPSFDEWVDWEIEEARIRIYEFIDEIYKKYTDDKEEKECGGAHSANKA